MQFVITTPLALVAAALLIWLGPVRGFWVLPATLPFGVTAAVNLPALGGTSLLVADIASLCFIALVLAERGRLAGLFAFLRVGAPGGLVLPLVAVAILGALFGPRLFADQIEVFSLTRAHGSGAVTPVPLAPSTGNLAQLVRFGLGLAVFACAALALSHKNGAHVVLRGVWIATLLHIGVSALSLVAPFLGAVDVMSWMRTANYEVLDHQAIGGIKRLVGGFPEATAHGRMTLGLFGFWAIVALRTGRGWWLAALLLAMLLRSLSTATWIAMIVVMMGLCLAHISQALKTRSTVVPVGTIAVVPMVCACAVAALLWVPQVPVLWDNLVASKLDSHSGQQRLAWNARAIAAFWESGGLGVGLGSLRGSGWIGVMLGSMGLLGSTLFATFLIQQFRAAWFTGSAISTALLAGAAAMLVQSAIVATTPDLGLSFFIFLGAAVGVARVSPRAAHPSNTMQWQVAE